MIGIAQQPGLRGERQLLRALAQLAHPGPPAARTKLGNPLIDVHEAVGAEEDPAPRSRMTRQVTLSAEPAPAPGETARVEVLPLEALPGFIVDVEHVGPIFGQGL